MRQQPNAILDIAGWAPDPDFPVFPVGSKPKRLVLCPQPPAYPFLIGGHRYMFKVPEGWQAGQLWSEVIAYELARSVGVPVPPCFVAHDSKTRETGVLLEFFYGYPSDPAPPRLIHGADILQGLFLRQAFDRKTGRPHDLRMNLRASRAFKVANAADWWGAALAFDAIIGNTDRHPENWGVLVRSPDDRMLAPLYDNGTSLAYEIPSDKLATPWPLDRVEAYIKRGRHHCSTVGTGVGAPHTDLCVELSKSDAAAGAAMERVILLGDSHIEGVLGWCEQFAVGNSFTHARADLLDRLLKARRDRLANALGL